MRSEKEIQIIFDELNDSEQFGLSFGLFPVKLMSLNLTNEECSKLIGISQAKTKVRY